MKKILLFILLNVLVFSSNKLEIKGINLESYKSYENFHERDTSYYIYEVVGETVYFTYSHICGNISNRHGAASSCGTVIGSGSPLSAADGKSFKHYEEEQEIDGIIYDAEDKNNYYYHGSVVKKK
ncbi:hypothetical protein [Sebaldella termitidis]|uniref:hypothetical protein n=1 Tax=Sebaldella termitidis TaxID=826 RepID=UPI003EBA3C8F